MTSREIVRRTVDFDGPERVARSFGESDFTGGGPDVKTHATEWQEIGDGRWERFDEWGNTWGRIDPTSKGEVTRGVLENLDDMDSYEFPDYSDPATYEPVRQKRAESPDVWFNGGIPGFAFNIARKLRRLDQYLVDILMEPERIHALHDRIDDMVEEMIRNYAAVGVDGVMFCEDWGTQAELLIDPALWRSEFGPRFERLCGVAHDLGIKVFMHSCGQIESVVPDMVAAGIDLFQFDQPELHGLDVLAGHQEKANVTFWCPVDIQTILQSGDESLIRQRARDILDTLWKGRGGFVAGFYGDNESIGLDPKWQEMACDEFTSWGVRERYEGVL
ncbi:MAG: hypothetical protein GY851_27570 [bacterium]|nr:hypothetical protein [bacterium]